MQKSALSSYKKRVSLTLDPQTVKTCYQKVFHLTQQQASLDGFRKGHVPLPILHKHFSHHIQSHVYNELIDKALALSHVLEEESVTKIIDKSSYMLEGNPKNDWIEKTKHFFIKEHLSIECTFDYYQLDYPAFKTYDSCTLTLLEYQALHEEQEARLAEHLSFTWGTVEDALGEEPNFIVLEALFHDHSFKLHAPLNHHFFSPTALQECLDKKPGDTMKLKTEDILQKFTFPFSFQEEGLDFLIRAKTYHKALSSEALKETLVARLKAPETLTLKELLDKHYQIIIGKLNTEHFIAQVEAWLWGHYHYKDPEFIQIIIMLCFDLLPTLQEQGFGSMMDRKDLLNFSMKLVYEHFTSRLMEAYVKKDAIGEDQDPLPYQLNFEHLNVPYKKDFFSYVMKKGKIMPTKTWDLAPIILELDKKMSPIQQYLNA